MTPRKSTLPTFTAAGLRRGVRMGLVILPSPMVFALVVGGTAAQKGLTLVESMAMNIFVYAGISQMVAMEMWPRVFTWDVVAAMAVVVAVVNGRHVLMGAALYPWFRSLPAWKVYPSLYVLTDPGWLVAMRYRAEGGRDFGVYIGSSVLFFVCWFSATVLGYLLGGLATDPRRFGLDLVMPVFFAVMLIPLWRGQRRAIGWAVAGVVALAVEHFVSGWWFIIAGAVVGSVVGALLDDTPMAEDPAVETRA